MMWMILMGIFLVLCSIFPYALCKASDEAERMFGYENMDEGHEMIQEDKDPE